MVLSASLLFLRERFPDVQWVQPENYHITLHFFGERATAEEILPSICHAINKTSTFSLSSQEGGIFKSRHTVYYLRFHENRVLSSLIDSLCQRFALPRQAFIPHVTLARSKPGFKGEKELAHLIKSKSIMLSFIVRHVILYESILHEGPVHYKEYARFSLADEDT